MKKIMYFSAAVCALVSFASCNEKEPVDIKIVGDLTLSAELSGKQLDAHGSWVAGDKLGVYVLSDGFDQDNLPYSATQAAASSLLQAEGTAAGYKAGKHTIYAYYPYSEASKSVKAVALPDLSNQKFPEFIGSYFALDTKYVFAYGSTEYAEEYSQAEIAIGKLATPFFDCSFPEAPVPDELKNKAVPELTISSDKVLAYKNATINLKTGKITGEPLYEIKASGEGATFYEAQGFFTATMLPSMHVILGQLFEQLDGAQITVSFTVDGTTYSSTATLEDKWGIGVVSLNMDYTEGE